MTRKVTAGERKRTAAETLLDPRVIGELALAIPGFDRAGLLDALVRCWGGIDRLAEDIFLEFRAAKPGTMTRQRTLDMVVRTISQESSSGEAQVPVEALDDQALRRQILAVVAELDPAPAGVGVEATPGPLGPLVEVRVVPAGGG